MAHDIVRLVEFSLNCNWVSQCCSGQCFREGGREVVVEAETGKAPSDQPDHCSAPCSEHPSEDSSKHREIQTQ